MVDRAAKGWSAASSDWQGILYSYRQRMRADSSFYASEVPCSIEAKLAAELTIGDSAIPAFRNTLRVQVSQGVFRGP